VARDLRGDERFDRAIEAIDAANADDPVRIIVRGEERPKELAHAELVTEWVRRLDPAPTDELLLAARAHHLRRWVIPRSSYPTGRSGYLRWRKAEHAQHAEDVARILDAAGYGDAAVTRVQDLVRKRGLGRDPATRDPEAQTLEDALCLVFLETQLTDLASRHDDDKMIDILRKSAAKMSEQGLDAAGEIELDERGRSLLERALAGG
jgi:Domain of unknown function (DUF4202)